MAIKFEIYYRPTKMDPAAYAGIHERDYGSLMDPRLNPHARDMVDPRHHMEDLRSHHSQFGGNAAGNGGYDHTGGNAGNIKTSSAFSPIQGSMLQASASGFMGGSRGYSFYDPIGFPKHHSQVSHMRKSRKTSD